MSKYAEVKPIRKNLPYTVTPIGDIDQLKTWRVQREAQEVKYQAKKQMRHDLIVKQLQNGTIGAKVFPVSKVTKDWQRFRERPQVIQRQALVASNKKSLMKSMIDSFLSWFISIKF